MQRMKKSVKCNQMHIKKKKSKTINYKASTSK
jgi:hypothetical protein